MNLLLSIRRRTTIITKKDQESKAIYRNSQKLTAPGIGY
jgi:hypothetical protein